MDAEKKMVTWLAEKLGVHAPQLAPLLTDASPRQYYRAELGNGRSYVVLDSSLSPDTLLSFVNMSRVLVAHQVSAPEVLYQHPNQPWLIMTDLGRKMYSDCLRPSTMARLYEQAIAMLIRIHQVSLSEVNFLTRFDSSYIDMELNLFTHWFLGELLSYQLTKEEQILLADLHTRIHQVFAEQPQVLLHRDFHSRNLMLDVNDKIGVVDIQDAIIGPITYDLVSLLKDAYVNWPLDAIRPLIQQFQIKAEERELLPVIRSKDLMRWFDWTGVQRHLKVVGIFSRLSIRDQKPVFLRYIPRLIEDLISTTAVYPESQLFSHWLAEHIQPRTMNLFSRQSGQLIG